MEEIPTIAEHIRGQLPAWDELIKVAPITTIVIGVLLVGVVIAWWLMSSHITSLKEIIEFLKNKN